MVGCGGLAARASRGASWAVLSLLSAAFGAPVNAVRPRSRQPQRLLDACRKSIDRP